MTVRYTISSRAPFTPGCRKTYHSSLIAALESAWRKHNRNWSINSIEREQQVIISGEALMQVFTQIDILTRERPKRSPHEILEQVIQEVGIVEANESESWG